MGLNRDGGECRRPFFVARINESESMTCVCSLAAGRTS
jgi:hypothetical protein